MERSGSRFRRYEQTGCADWSESRDSSKLNLRKKSTYGQIHFRTQHVRGCVDGFGDRRGPCPGSSRPATLAKSTPRGKHYEYGEKTGGSRYGAASAGPGKRVRIQ